MSRPRRVIAAVLLVFALAFTTAAPASAFTVEQAQAFFLTQVCAPNNAIDQLNNAVFRGNPNFRPRKMHGKRLRQTRRALVRLARIERAVGLRLIAPPSSWPTPESAAATDALGRAFVIDGRILNKLRARAGVRFVRYWNNVMLPHNDLLIDLEVSAGNALGVAPDATCSPARIFR